MVSKPANRNIFTSAFFPNADVALEDTTLFDINEDLHLWVFDKLKPMFSESPDEGFEVTTNDEA